MTFTSCSACHATNPISARFCRGCGSLMAEHEAQTSAHLAKLQICEHCNTRCPVTAKFCRACGESFTKTASIDQTLAGDFLACPECSEPCAANAKLCKACGHLFADQTETVQRAPIATTAPPQQFAEYASVISHDDADQLNDLYALLDQVEKLAATPPEASTGTSQESVAETLPAVTPSAPTATTTFIAPAKQHRQAATSPNWKDKLFAARRTIAIAAAFILMLSVVATYWYRYQQEAPIRAAAEQARRETAARVKAENEARALVEAEARAKAEAEAAARARAEAAAEQDAIAWPQDEMRLQKEADVRAREARLREIAKAEARAKAAAEAEAKAKAKVEAEMAKHAKAESARIEAQAAADKAKNIRNKKTAPPAAPVAPLETPVPPPPPKSVDETYREKSQACESSFGSFFCKERLRYQLCANRWSSDPKSGEKICLQQQGIQ